MIAMNKAEMCPPASSPSSFGLSPPTDQICNRSYPAESTKDANNTLQKTLPTYQSCMS